MKRRYKILNGFLAFLGIAVVTLCLVVSHDSPCSAAAPLPNGVIIMKAWKYRCYGAPEVLKLELVGKPGPADDELIVRVLAASVNPLDWHYLRGTPYLMRMEVGIGAPTESSLGVDFAGTVEEVGKDVKHFKPGDAVFGARTGAFGEYVHVRESRNVLLKPANISFEEAAAVPIAAVTALQALRDTGKLKAGQKVLINGASGGVGTYAVQIAKALGAEVTGVCSGRNVEMVRSLGADHVVDYTKEDFTAGTDKYDLILDNVGTHSLSEYRRVMNPAGIFVIVGGPNEGKFLGPMTGIIKAKAYGPFVSQQFLFMLAQLNPQDLTTLRDMLAAGTIKSVIDRTYKFEDVPAAIAYLETGRARGKVIVRIE